MASRIRTTVVGSYSVLPWMVGNSSRLMLRDAIMAVLKTQELAGNAQDAMWAAEAINHVLDDPHERAVHNFFGNYGG